MPLMKADEVNLFPEADMMSRELRGTSNKIVEAGEKARPKYNWQVRLPFSVIAAQESIRRLLEDKTLQR